MNIQSYHFGPLRIVNDPSCPKFVNKVLNAMKWIRTSESGQELLDQIHQAPGKIFVHYSPEKNAIQYCRKLSQRIAILHVSLKEAKTRGNQTVPHWIIVQRMFQTAYALLARRS